MVLLVSEDNESWNDYQFVGRNIISILYQFGHVGEILKIIFDVVII